MSIEQTTRLDSSEGHGRRAFTGKFAELARRIIDHSATIGVVGQGYVGFPLAQRSAQQGFRTVGFDNSEAVLARSVAQNAFGNYIATCDAEQLAACDVILVAVPTPTEFVDGKHRPDISIVVSAVETVAQHALHNDKATLVLLESTYAPGTTRSLVAPILNRNGGLGKTLAVGYSPERIDPGNEVYGLSNITKVTSGIDRQSAALTELFYSEIIDEVRPATSMEAAEATKLLENTFRFINITFAQEFDEYCTKVGLSAREITELAATKPFGFMPFFAGAGIGGHCIAEDPYYLREAMADSGHDAPILDAAIVNHEARANVVVDRIAKRTGRSSLDGARVLLLGVSYKPQIGDTRQSPAKAIMQKLEERGADVSYHDPFVPEFAGRKSTDLKTAKPADYDVAVLITHHANIDWLGMGEANWNRLDARDASAHGNCDVKKR